MGLETKNFGEEPNEPGLRGFPNPELNDADKELVEEYGGDSLFPGELEDYEAVQRPEDISAARLTITNEMVGRAASGSINRTRGNLAYWPPNSSNTVEQPTTKWELFDNGAAAQAIKSNPLDGSRIVLNLINHNLDNQRPSLN